MTRRMRIKIRRSLELRNEDLDEKQRRGILRSFTYRNGEYQRRIDAGLPDGGLSPTFRTWAESGDVLRIYRGTSRRLARILGAEPEWIDQATRVPVEWPRYLGTLRPYQRRAALSAVIGRQGIVVGPCGSGKTEILLAAAAKTGQRTLVLVDTKDLQRQWIERFVDRYDGSPGDVGALGGVASEPDAFDWHFVNRNALGSVLTVATAQTLRNRLGVLDEVGCLVADEVHLWAARTFRETVAASPSAWRLGGTATLQRSDGLVRLITDTFGDILYEVTEQELIDAGVRQAVAVRLVPTPFHVDARPAWRMIGGRRKWAPMPWNDVLSAMIKDRARHSVAAATCATACSEGSTLVLSTRRAYAARLGHFLAERGYRVGSVFGGTARASDCLECGAFPRTESKRKTCAACGATLLRRAAHNTRALEMLRAGDLDAVVATSVADKGLDVPRLERIVVVLPTAGGRGTKISARLKQQVGRLSRPVPGKTAPRLDYLSDDRMGFGKDRAKAIKRAFGLTN